MQTTIAHSTKTHFDTAPIRQRLAEGQELVNSGQLGAAAAVFWTSFEEAVRLSLAELGEQTDRPIWFSDTPRGLASQAVAYGVIDPEDRDVLLRFLQAYDESAEGKAEAIDVSLLQRVKWLAERTLAEMNQN